MPESQTVEDLGKLVKSKYPDAYGTMADIEVGRSVKAKYPEYSNFSDIEDKPQGTIGKVQSFLGAGKGYDPFKQEGPHMPAAVQNVGTALSLAEPGMAIARNPEGIINLGKSLYEGARAGLPKILGGGTLAAAGGGIEAGAESIVGHPTSYGRYIATLPGLKMMYEGLKEGAKGFAGKFNPASFGDLASESTDVVRPSELPPGLSRSAGSWEPNTLAPKASRRFGGSTAPDYSSPSGPADVKIAKEVPDESFRTSGKAKITSFKGATDPDYSPPAKPTKTGKVDYHEDTSKVIEDWQSAGKKKGVQTTPFKGEVKSDYSSPSRSIGKVKSPIRGETTSEPEEAANVPEKESLNIEKDFPEIQRRVRSGEIKEGDPLHRDYTKATEEMQSDFRAAKESRLANHLIKTDTDLVKIPKTSEYLKALKRESGEKNDISLRTLEGAIVKARAIKAKL